jgi:hypothetical protein
LGEKRTTFTAAECRLSVARYSTLGGLGEGTSAFAPEVEVEALATGSTGMIFGCTIHIFKFQFSFVKTTRSATRIDHKSHPDVIILAAGSKSVTLPRKVLLLSNRRTRFLE